MLPRLVADRPPRAVAYVRVSDEGGRGDNLMSPQIQLSAIRDYCQRRGYELTTVLEDIDRSGRFWQRRKIEAAVGMIEAGDADLIVVWKVSRVARNRLDWAVAVDRVEGAGGQLESATEPNDTATSAGRFTRGMLAELAAFESDRIGEGWRETHAARVRAGLTPTGRAPWPWSHDGRNLAIDAQGAAHVRELYARYLGGQGFKALADHLTASGVPTARGGRWSMTTVKAILDHPAHAGRVRLNGAEYPGAHDGVIDEATREAYLAQRRDARRAGRRQASPYLLSGLLVCADLVDGQACGHRWAGQGNALGAGRPRYRCDHAARTGAHSAGSVPAEIVEGAVMAWLAAEAAGDLNAAIDAEPVVDDSVDVLAIESRIAELDRQLVRLTGLLVAGTVPEAAYAATRLDIEGQVEVLTVALRAASDARALAGRAPLAADVLAEWDGLDIMARRAALRALIRQVTIRSAGGLAVAVIPAWS
jgi:DNA invertase Pin-like site-specific DNA recombinase